MEKQREWLPTYGQPLCSAADQIYDKVVSKVLGCMKGTVEEEEKDHFKYHGCACQKSRMKEPYNTQRAV